MGADRVVRKVRGNTGGTDGRPVAVRCTPGVALSLCLLCVFGTVGVCLDLVYLSRVDAWLRDLAPVYSIRDLHALVVGIGWLCSFVVGSLCAGLLAKGATGGGEVT